MFTPADRTRVREQLLDSARSDDRITGAAITGSGAAGGEDEWSDVDLAFGVARDARVADVIGDWTELMYRDHGAVDDFDVPAGTWIYRVFLLDSTLQVDLAFAPESDFGARASTFKLAFGNAVELPTVAPPRAGGLVGMGWLYALHARSCIERGQVWRAEFMISGLRDQVLALACLRNGLPTSQGRGFDQLPSSVTLPLEPALVRALEPDELRRAFGAAVDGLLAEAKLADRTQADRIDSTVRALARQRPPGASHG